MSNSNNNIVSWKQLINHPDYKTYFKEQPLSKEEEQVAIWIYQNSTDSKEKQQAADDLLKGKGGLFVYYAKHFVKAGSDISPQEAFHAATIGWLSAAKEFDLETSNALSSPGVPRVMREIRKVLKDKDHLNIEQRKNTKILKETIEKFYEKNNRLPNNQEIANETGWKPSKIQEVSQMSNSIASLDSPITDEQETTIGSQIEDIKESKFAEEYEQQQDNLETLTQLFDVIEENEKEIILLHYFGTKEKETLSFSEIALEKQKSEQEIKEIHDQAIGKMKNYAVKMNLHM